MVFSSILFLCIFLPVTVLLYYILPHRFRNFGLLTVSLIFYAWGEPKYIIIMLFSTVFDYTNGILLEKFDKKEVVRKIVLICSVVINLGILCYFKYTDFAIENINRIFGTDISALSLALPIGISFYTFQTLSYTIDVYRRKVMVQHNIINFGMYICLFPQLIAGPIVRYADIEKEIANRKENSDKIWHGLFRFIIGLGKKVVFANQIGSLWNEISANKNNPALTAWLGAAAFAFQIYFDFSGYSDMAIGLGEMFGFHFPENFDYPYESKSITEFWRRWHITLSSWFKEYLYIPLGGNRCGIFRQIINLLIVWLLTGLWHGAAWNFVIWGLFYFVLLTIEKLFFKKISEKLPNVFKHIYALFFIMIGWVIFACEDINDIGNYLLSMFGVFGGADSMSIYYLMTYGIMFIILIIASTCFPKKTVLALRSKIGNKTKLNFAAEFVFSAIVLILSITFLVGDSYNPFLYFRF